MPLNKKYYSPSPNLLHQIKYSPADKEKRKANQHKTKMIGNKRPWLPCHQCGQNAQVEKQSNGSDEGIEKIFLFVCIPVGKKRRKDNMKKKRNGTDFPLNLKLRKKMQRKHDQCCKNKKGKTLKQNSQKRIISHFYRT